MCLLSLTMDSDHGTCPADRVSRHLATKTPYRFVANTATDEPDAAPEGCEPRQFWLISRHGTRYPSRRGLTDIVERLPEVAREIR